MSLALHLRNAISGQYSIEVLEGSDDDGAQWQQVGAKEGATYNK